MIINRLKYLAVCLLVLLNVVSTMGGNTDDYKYYNYVSKRNTSLCLSFKNNRLTDCCKSDPMQKIFVLKTGGATGIYHVNNFSKVLCYDVRNNKFKLFRRRKLQLCKHRHQRRREQRHIGQRRHGASCKPRPEDKERLRRLGCELHETMAGGYTYISFDEKSRFLGLRRGRVRKHKRLRDGGWREPKSGFFAFGEKNNLIQDVCRA